MKQTPKKQTAKKTAVSQQPVSTPRETSTGLLELLTDGIKDMYWAENHLVTSLPKMVSAAGSSDLQTALAEHLELTKNHASRLEAVLELLGTKIEAKKCDAMEGLVMSGEHVIENTVAGTAARDTGIIMSALKVENFEITGYNGLIQLATTLEQSDIAQLLIQNLSDEIDADEMLTAMSQSAEGADADTVAE